MRLLAATGMRRGEACALRWRDLDFELSTITIDENIIGARGGALVKGPKTRASIRAIACDRGTLDAIVNLRNEQEAFAQASVEVLRSESFVFSYEPGGIVLPHPGTVSHAMVRVRRRSGIAGDIHLHSLRHFQATALDPVVSESQKQARLGWSTVQMARHYTGGVPDEDRRAADHMGELLG